MGKKSGQYDDYDDSLYEDDEDDISSIDDKEDFQEQVVECRNNKLATWRKIEDFWDNYELNKRINGDSYNDSYFDQLD